MKQKNHIADMILKEIKVVGIYRLTMKKVLIILDVAIQGVMEGSRQRFK